MSNVHVQIIVSYSGTLISKGIAVPGDASDPVKINRGLDFVTKQIQIMVQSAQGVREGKKEE